MVLRMEDLIPSGASPPTCPSWPRTSSGWAWTGTPAGSRGTQSTPQSHPPRRLPDRLSPAGGAGPGLPCFCTRKELLAASAPHASDGARVYDGRCRRLSPREKAALWTSGRSPAWRVQVPKETVPLQMAITAPQAQRLDRDCGDFILRQSDGVYAYQLAVAADEGHGDHPGGAGWGPPLLHPPADLAAGAAGLPVPAYCHVPSSWPRTVGGCPSGTRTWTWATSGPLHPRKGHRAAGLAGRAPAPAKAGAAQGTHRGLRLDQGGRPGQGGGRGGLAGPLVLLELLPEELDGLFLQPGRPALGSPPISSPSCPG